jgi:rhamnosyltransferase
MHYMMKKDKYNTFIKNTFIILVLYKKKLPESISFQSLQTIFKNADESIDILIYDNSPEPIDKQELDEYQHIYLKENGFHPPDADDQLNRRGTRWRYLGNSIPAGKDVLNISHRASPNEDRSLRNGINILYLHNAANPGISKAYNVGYKIAKKLGKKWLLLLDQDTLFNEDMFKQYFYAIDNNPDIYLFAARLTDQNEIFSPCKYYLKRGFLLHDIKPGLHSLIKIALLNSGILIAAQAFGKTGGYDEKIRLDFADFEFLERFKKYYQNFYLINYQCIHHFASISNKNQQEVMDRYKYFCNGAVHFSQSFSDFLILMLWTLIRGIKLSFQYKNFIFFILFVKFFLLKKELP